MNLRRTTNLAALWIAGVLNDPALAGVAYPPPSIPDGLRKLDGPAYVLYHDLTDAEAAEVQARMTAMAREYETRTRGFAGRVQGKMPFLLFRRDADYVAAGGMEGSGGLYNGQVLMAVAGRKLTADTWHTIQHEGFHQYAHLVIGGTLPPWVNEGLAEYFGEGVYCGDGFVTGGIPAYRCQRIKDALKADQFLPVADMMRLTQEQWNARLTETNYDQAWAMVQFLAHADNGKYADAFVRYMTDLSRGHAPATAWANAFGPAEGFEAAFVKWWQGRPADPTLDVYATAAVRQLAGYASRAASQNQPMASVDALIAALKRDAVRSAPADAWPAGLAVDAVDLAAALGKAGVKLAMEFPKKGNAAWPLAVTATLPDGRVIRGTALARGERAGPVQVTVVTPKETKPAGR